MLFYKFNRPDNLSFTMLRKGEIFFASPAELNDAHECRPRLVLSGSVELWSRLSSYLLERICFESELANLEDPSEIKQLLGLGEPAGLTLKRRVRARDLELRELGSLFAETLGPSLGGIVGPKRSEIMVKWVHRFIEERLPEILAEEPYICSFCLSATNPTMWAHYADAERGFAVVYAAKDSKITIKSPISILNGRRPKGNGGIIEIGTYKDEAVELKKVRYATKVPKVNAFFRLIPKFTYSEAEDHYDVPLLLPEDANEKKEAILGLLKYSAWRYEKEIRAFFPTYGRLAPDARSVRVDYDNVLGLILGPRITTENAIRAILCCHLMAAELEHQPSRKLIIFRARQSTEHFRLIIEPECLVSGRYDGRHLPVRPIKNLLPDELLEVQKLAEQIGTS